MAQEAAEKLVQECNALAADTPHCVVKESWPIIITQCDDGTVTVTNVSKGKASVCRKGDLCREISL
ncbi:hypothetical protein H8818_003918 [Salmonella enterica]|nr:hypothetical protein [Salmonella enterica]EBK1016268.1 hypothetical protein [Salmonella enterica]EBL1712113.1 hypothetical protein [Salmonella enterica]ECG8815127.1 hypothetical protein [Salmonella enterica]ECK4232338.1 hypothetical protein [Salmonella enterica]